MDAVITAFGLVFEPYVLMVILLSAIYGMGYRLEAVDAEDFVNTRFATSPGAASTPAA